MKANLLSFTPTFYLDNDPADITIQDTSDYSANAETDSNGVQTFAIANSQVEGIVNLRLPNGDLFYDGDDTFATPDIDRDVSDVKSGIELELDANGDYYLGNYEMEYKVRITDEVFHMPVFSLSNTGGKGIIQITGNYKSIIEDQTVLAILTGHADVGVKTFESVSYNSSTGRTTVQISETFTDTDAAGCTLAVTATRTYSLTNNYNFQYTASVVTIGLEADCDKSQLQSTDNTDYSQYDGAAPSSRTHTLKYPRDLVPAKSDIVSPQKLVSINPIYTNNWTSTLASTVIKTQSDGLVIQDLLEGTNNINVQCDTKLCTIYACLENISTNFVSSIQNQNNQNYIFWKNLWIKVQGWLHLYKQAKACGDASAAATYYANIVASAQTASCCPDTSAGTGVSTLVVPVTSGGLTTVYNELVNQWLTGTGVPSDSIGNDGDFYLKNADPNNGDVYQKGSGTWTVITNLKGADGADGSNGTNGSNGIDGTALLFSDATKRTLNGATAGLQDMTGRSYTMPAGTVALKDAIRVVFDMYRADPSKLNEQMNLKIGSNDLTFDLPFQTDQYRYEVDIVPEGLTTVKILWRWFSSFSNGQAATEVPTQVEPGSSYQSQGAFTVSDLDANSLTIKVQGNVQASNAFISQMMRVEQLKTS